MKLWEHIVEKGALTAVVGGIGFGFYTIIRNGNLSRVANIEYFEETSPLAREAMFLGAGEDGIMKDSEKAALLRSLGVEAAIQEGHDIYFTRSSVTEGGFLGYPITTGTHIDFYSGPSWSISGGLLSGSSGGSGKYLGTVDQDDLREYIGSRDLD